MSNRSLHNLRRTRRVHQMLLRLQLIHNLAELYLGERLKVRSGRSPLSAQFEELQRGAVKPDYARIEQRVLAHANTPLREGSMTGRVTISPVYQDISMPRTKSNRPKDGARSKLK